jgi:hypothetical protein
MYVGGGKEYGIRLLPLPTTYYLIHIRVHIPDAVESTMNNRDKNKRRSGEATTAVRHLTPNSEQNTVILVLL